MKKLLFLFSIFSFITIGSFFYHKNVSAATNGDMIACTQDVKLCPDGSYVVRVAPDCSFAPCPDENLNGTPSPSPVVNCQTNDDCLPGQNCYQPPMPSCPPGAMCAQVMPQKYCTGETTLPETCPIYNGEVMCPQWDPAPGFCEGGTLIPQPDNECGCSQPPKCEYPESSPSPSPQVSCQTDADCSSDELCYQPPMPECPEGMACAQVMPAKICKPILGEGPPSPSPEIMYCDTYQGPNDQSVCPSGYVCASVPPGGCGTGPNGEPLACATRPYCRLAEGASCENNDGCYNGYNCESGQCARSKVADLNSDGKVNINDFTILSSQMMLSGTQSADLNQDGIVNIKDFTIMMSEF